MKLYVGVDLGSTTTKAVVMDDGGRLLGKGITNSRSNYDTACAIAKTEALIDTRFSLFGRSMEALDSLTVDRAAFMTRLEASFRLQQYLVQLRCLADTALQEADSKRYGELRAPLRAKLEALFGEMMGQAPALFAPGAKRRSDFFRDLAGSVYMSLSERYADPNGVNYALIVGIYDKCIIRVENSVLDLSFETHVGKSLDTAFDGIPHLRAAERAGLGEVAREAAANPLEIVTSVGTGYGRARLPFPKEHIRSEILCHGLGAHWMYPHTATVLDIGGQDTKAIQVDGEGIVTGFQMNDRCAAGCGRYLGYIADELNIGVQELGPLAMQADKTVRINSTCTVFAGAELRERLNNGERREDILRGLHRAIVLRAMSLLARSGGISDEFTFTGGVANNAAAVAALQELVLENYGERRLNISPNSIFTGAIGAALFALRGTAKAA